jgi:hypothetical protein
MSFSTAARIVALTTAVVACMLARAARRPPPRVGFQNLWTLW